MSVYRRHFKIASGPLVEKAVAVVARSREMMHEVNAVATRLGGEAKYYPSGFGGGWVFAGLAPTTVLDTDLWRQDRSSGFWLPRAKPLKGKKAELAELRKQLEPYEKITMAWSVLDDVPNLHNSPLLYDGREAYSPQFQFIAKMPGENGELAPVIYVSIPWKDVPKAEMDAYLADDSYWSSELQFLSKFVPPADWLEIKEWEKLRDIDMAEQAAKEGAQ